MGFLIEYDVTRDGWNGQVTHTFTEYCKTRKLATQTLERIEKEYSKAELTRLETIVVKRR